MMSVLTFKPHKGNRIDTLPDRFAYVTREPVTNPRYLYGFSVEPEDFVDAVEAIALAYGQKFGKLYVQIILAFDPLEDENKSPDEVYNVAKWIGTRIATYGRHQFIGIMDLHLDTSPAHVHYLFNTIDVNSGQRFNPNKKELADIKKLADYDLRHFGFSGIRMFHPQHNKKLLW